MTHKNISIKKKNTTVYTRILFYKFLIYDMFVADFKLYRSFIPISAKNIIFKRYFVFAN